MLVKLLIFLKKSIFSFFKMYLLLILPEGSINSLKCIFTILFTQFNATFPFSLWSVVYWWFPRTSVFTIMLYNSHPEISFSLHSGTFCFSSELDHLFPGFWNSGFLLFLGVLLSFTGLHPPVVILRVSMDG